MGGIFSFDCMLQWLGNRAIFYKVLLINFSPFLVFFLFFMFSQVVRRMNCLESRMRRMRECTSRTSHISHFFIISYYLFPMIIKQTLQLFVCVTLNDDNSLRVMKFELDQECWKHDQIIYGFTAFTLSFVGWGFIFHGFFLRILFKCRKEIQKLIGMAWLKTPTIEQMRGDMALERMVSFIWISYSKKAYFWEFVIIGRKVFLILIGIMMNNLSYQWRTIFVLLMVLIMIRLHLGWEPYGTSLFNHIESASLFVIYISTIAGLLMDIQEQYTLNGVLLALVISVNMLFTIASIAFTAASIRRDNRKKD
eukprot:TRINITY_DN14123_c0_g1_i1.p1 TRINITY_DN14123_c0_g1~~TRINITY_DN14123_c0_g1_i1.p1  ORF type:complete len:321 (-),score=28.92 TRINITY_DN14123_c0_g1_i1:35-958(-)